MCRLGIIAIGAKDRSERQARLDVFMRTPAGCGVPEKHRALLREMGYRL